MQPCLFSDKPFVELCCKGACSACGQEWFHNLTKTILWIKSEYFLHIFHIFRTEFTVWFSPWRMFLLYYEIQFAAFWWKLNYMAKCVKIISEVPFWSDFPPYWVTGNKPAPQKSILNSLLPLERYCKCITKTWLHTFLLRSWFVFHTLIQYIEQSHSSVCWEVTKV